MFRRLTSLRTLKWTGTIACVLVSMATATCLRCTIHWQRGCPPYERKLVLLCAGAVIGYWESKWPDTTTIDYSGPQDGLSLLDPSHASEWRRWQLPKFHADSSIVFVVIPLWLLGLIFAVPTTVLWRLDRRPLPNHCRKCNYNLTANTSGRCPECGTPLERPA